MEPQFDVIVSGAGPAGSTCAAYLGRAGHKVLLLDRNKFPRDKACGDGVGFTAMKVLKELGLEDCMQRYKPIRGITVSSPKGKVLRVAVPETEAGYVCPRAAFDQLLIDNARRHAAVKTEFLVRDITRPAGVRGTDMRTGKDMEFTSKLLIAADGADSLIARKLGVFSTDVAHHVTALRTYYRNVKGLTDDIEIHFVEGAMPGYFWIFPISDNEANVGIGALTKYVIKKKLKLQDLMFDLINNHPLFKERFAEAVQTDAVKGWNLPLGSRRRKCYYDNIMLTGDAASLVDPLTGEGIGEAMFSAKLAAQVADKALKQHDVSEKALKEYDELLTKHFGWLYRKNYFVQRVLAWTPALNLVMDVASVKYGQKKAAAA